MGRIKPVQQLCPEHGRMKRVETEWGPRYDCQEPGCTVRCWCNDTSRPGDAQTRRARHVVHQKFDPWWRKNGGMPRRFGRGELYSMLRRWMMLPPKENHIGMFTIEQCRFAWRFCQQLDKGGRPGTRSKEENMTGDDIREFNAYLDRCTDEQVWQVLDKEKEADRDAYVALVERELGKRNIRYGE